MYYHYKIMNKIIKSSSIPTKIITYTSEFGIMLALSLL